MFIINHNKLFYLSYGKIYFIYNRINKSCKDNN